ncbi:MAG TPA: cation:proton antiporter [Tenuifilaceae bacterium]|nr:cation:proton antiporter [Tenuifilaceae bacterium]HPN22444.1 cation:proton antiporter [Tenuifilaceae bacterium]
MAAKTNLSRFFRITILFAIPLVGLLLVTDSFANDSVVLQTADTVLVQSHQVQEQHQAVDQEGQSGHGTNLAPLLFIIISLFVGTATRHLLKKGPLPYTISLLIIGLLLGVLTRSEILQRFGMVAIADSVKWAGSIDPHLILYLFLPTLIFEAAYALHLHTFKKSLVNSLILAIPGIVVAMIITALFVMMINSLGLGLGHWTWIIAFLFGAIVSATDPVAVVAILKEVGASKKLSTITESESMLNDGTAIVFFLAIFALVVGDNSGGNAFVQFFKVSLGGVVVGGAVGWLVIGWIKRVFNDALIEITVIIGAAYLTFFLAENVFHVSGVIAVVTLGIAMAGPGKTRVSPGVTHFLHEFWELAAFIANTLIFIIVGVVIAQQVTFTLNDLIVLMIVYVGVHVARLGTIYVFYPIMKRIGYGLSFKDSIVLWWGGLRGAVGLALALIVAIEEKIPLEVRSQVLTLTAGLVVLTSLINATTVKWLIDKLGLSKVGEIKAELMQQSLNQIKLSGEKEIEKMKESRFMADANWEKVREFLIDTYEISEEVKSFKMEDAIAETRKRLLQKERESYWRQFSEGVLSSNGVNILSDQIDYLMDSGGRVSLSARQDIEMLWHTPKTTAKLQGLPLIGIFWKRRFFNRLAISYDCARAFVTAQEENIKSLSSLIIGFSMTDETNKQTELLTALEDELNENRITGLTFIRNLKDTYPDVCKAIETQLASRSLLNQQQEMVERLRKQGRLEPDEVERIEASIQSDMKRLLDASPSIDLEFEAMSVLVHTPGFDKLSKTDLHVIIRMSQGKVYPAESRVYKEGATFDGIYIVLNGSARALKGDRLIGVRETTDSIGAYEFLTGGLRRHTVIAETPLSVLKINHNVIDSLISVNKSFVNLFDFLAAAHISSELLSDIKPYSDYSAKKLRATIKNGKVVKISEDDKQRLEGSVCILVKGKAIADESETDVLSPAVLDDCNVRSIGDSVVFLIP